MTAIEAARFLAKDVPLVIDDFAPQFSSLAEARSMHKKAHHVVRSVMMAFIYFPVRKMSLLLSRVDGTGKK